MSKQPVFSLEAILDFDGRSGRKEYITYQIVALLPSLLLTMYMMSLFINGINSESMEGVMTQTGKTIDKMQTYDMVLTVFAQFLCVPVTIRRLNDLDKSKWISCLTFIPYVNWAIGFWLSCMKGVPSLDGK